MGRLGINSCNVVALQVNLPCYYDCFLKLEKQIIFIYSDNNDEMNEVSIEKVYKESL